MGFKLKSTRSLLSRLSGSFKNNRNHSEDDVTVDKTSKDVILKMADHDSSCPPSLARDNSQRSLSRSSSAKRLLSSFTMSRLSSTNNRREHQRRASIETSKISSSFDFHSSRLYHNDSEIEENSHSSYSELNVLSSSTPQHNQQLSQTSSHQRKSSTYVSPPPMRIAEGNSSEEFSSGSIHTRLPTSPSLQVAAAAAGFGAETTDGNELLAATEHRTNVTYPSSYRSKHVIKQNDEGDDETGDSLTFLVEDKILPLIEPAMQSFERESHETGSGDEQPKRASGCSRVSNLSDDYEEEDQLGCYMGVYGNDVNFNLEFVPSDLRADYLLVYEYLQDEALLASIQDENWRAQVRSTRLRSNSRHHLSQNSR